jgi:predicted nucleotidyltransferase
MVALGGPRGNAKRGGCLEPSSLGAGPGWRFSPIRAILPPMAASSDYPEWSRRADAARRAGLALTERVQSQRHDLELIFIEHGVREAYLFGSVARGEGRPGSDVDIAVAGCPPAVFYRLAARLERALALPLDLVDLDMAPADFAAPIRQSGLRLYPPAAAAPSNPEVEGHDKG